MERVGVERVGRGRNGLGKEQGGGMGTICSQFLIIISKIVLFLQFINCKF